MPSDPAERSRIGRIAALAKSAQAPDGAALTEHARRAFNDKFYNQTDPDLPERERQRQADAAKKLHMTRLAQRSAVARRRVRRAVDELIDADSALADA